MTHGNIPFKGSNIINFQDTFYKSVSSALRFNDVISIILLESISEYTKTILESDNIAKDMLELEKIVRSRINNIFNSKFRDKDFVGTISDTVANYSYFIKIIGYRQVYQNFANLWARWNTIL